ncbi:hypothetical protein V1525DRAFT_350715 [Lipomyces kononenkoae]|uniref:Uncharacterized protein n=1 Tax=Lipomyces kononenkoae TaxID=34357 RepID=A0ACC3STT1_LIPKO
MVYCGKPSKACGDCRTRRIKCDEATPACSQCLRANRRCPGYRDPLDLLFREQSEEVARKASQKANDYKNNNRVRLKLTTPPDVLCFPAPSSVEEEGIRFLLDRYLKFPSFTPGDLWNLSLLRPPHKRPCNMLRCAMASVGLAALSNVRNDESLMVLARHNYISALRLTMTSLQSPLRAGLDQTLRSVLLLGLFELVVCDISSKYCWASHFDGAAAILKLRGINGCAAVEEATSLLLIWFQIAISSIKRHSCLPPAMIDYPESCRQYLSELEHPACSLASIVEKFIPLWASMGQERPIELTAAISSALDLENELENWAKCLPASWAFKKVPCRRKIEDVGIGDIEHVYTNRFIANIWSWYRTVRILVNDLLIRLLMMRESVPEDYNAILDNSLVKVRQLAAEIYYSAPYFLEFFRTRTDITRVHVHGAFTLLWPLEVVGSTGGLSEAVYSWVVSTLRHIGQCLGINMALEAVNQIARDSPDNWFSSSQSEGPCTCII